MPASQCFTWTPSREGELMIVVPFDPKQAFGKARAPVVVTINGYSYRSTIALMGGPPFVPLRKSHREAAGVKAGVAVDVTLALDEAERTVDVPEDLAAALAALPGGQAAWNKISLTHRREYVEALLDARRPETRRKRLEKAMAFVAGRIKG